jgi:hypothetical protein
MKREEMVELRNETFKDVERMRQIGDYGAGAADIRNTAERQLELIDHLLERMRA